MGFVCTNAIPLRKFLITDRAGWQSLSAFLLCNTSDNSQEYFCKAWHDAFQLLNFYPLILRWDKEGVGVFSHFNAFYNASRCCMLVSLRASHYHKIYMLYGLKDTLQCDNKRHINLTKMIKRSCKDAIEHARTLQIIFPKDLKKIIAKQSTCTFSTMIFT